MTDNKIEWFEDFLGLGYHVYDVRPTVYLIFDSRRKIINAWNKIIKYWPDDEIKARFFSGESDYDFVLYGKSRIISNMPVFLKSLKMSEHYKQFMDEYNGSASLQLALYFPKEKKYELEIFKFKKRLTDVKFLRQQDEDDDFVVSQALQNLRAQKS